MNCNKITIGLLLFIIVILVYILFRNGSITPATLSQSANTNSKSNINSKSTTQSTVYNSNSPSNTTSRANNSQYYYVDDVPYNPYYWLSNWWYNEPQYYYDYNYP